MFGEVVEGLNVVDFIATTKTGHVGRMGDVPMEPIIIEEVQRLQP